MRNATCRCSILQLSGLAKSYSAGHIVIPNATHRRRAQPRVSYAATYNQRRSISHIGDSRGCACATAWWPSVREGIGSSGRGMWGSGECRKLSESRWPIRGPSSIRTDICDCVQVDPPTGTSILVNRAMPRISRDTK